VAVDSIITESSIVAVGEDTVSCALADGAAVLDLNSSTYFTLNEVGARVWNLIAQPKSVGEVRDALVALYEVAPDRCYGDLISLLERLADAGLIRTVRVAPPPVSGLERVG
jgi:hypothetical protein